MAASPSVAGADRAARYPAESAGAPRATRPARNFRSRPGRDRPLLALAVDDEVDLLVEEAHQPSDARVLRDRGRVAPHEVLHDPVADADRPPRRDSLVRADRGGGGGQELG